VIAPETRRRGRRVAGVLVGVTLATMLLGFGLSRNPDILRPTLVGRPAPDFALRTLDDSRTVRLSDLEGQVVVINFWASWCVECRVEHPALRLAWQRYRDRGVTLVGISFQDRPEDSRAYAAEMGGDWPLLQDPGSRTALAYGVYGVPETIFVGRDGRVAHEVIGPVSFELLGRWINRLLEAG
jgi:cytochrome c biogenesis protein CcmG/thiol:disulfide interchange protein DsbE